MPSFSYSYTYDAAGNRTQMVNNLTAEVTTYAYDGANQLLSETNSAGTTTYDYDADGNQTRKETPTELTEYTWDETGKMTLAQPPAGDVSFKYNAQGQRLEKETTAEVRRFLYDFQRLYEESDAADDPLREYTFGPDNYEENPAGYGDLISEYDFGDDETYGHTYDAQWNTEALLDDSESQAAQYKYRAFGLIESQSGTESTNLNFVGKQGYYRDEEIGLYLLDVRYYDPTTARFTSEDPSNDDLNEYRYAKNNPVNIIDPSGRDPNSEPSEEFHQLLMEMLRDQRNPSGLEQGRSGQNRGDSLRGMLSGRLHSTIQCHRPSDHSESFGPSLSSFDFGASPSRTPEEDVVIPASACSPTIDASGADTALAPALRCLSKVEKCPNAEDAKCLFSAAQKFVDNVKSEVESKKKKKVFRDPTPEERKELACQCIEETQKGKDTFLDMALNMAIRAEESTRKHVFNILVNPLAGAAMLGFDLGLQAAKVVSAIDARKALEFMQDQLENPCVKLLPDYAKFATSVHEMLEGTIRFYELISTREFQDELELLIRAVWGKISSCSTSVLEDAIAKVRSEITGGGILVTSLIDILGEVFTAGLKLFTCEPWSKWWGLILEQGANFIKPWEVMPDAWDQVEFDFLQATHAFSKGELNVSAKLFGGMTQSALGLVQPWGGYIWLLFVALPTTIASLFPVVGTAIGLTVAQKINWIMQLAITAVGLGADLVLFVASLTDYVTRIKNFEKQNPDFNSAEQSIYEHPKLSEEDRSAIRGDVIQMASAILLALVKLVGTVLGTFGASLTNAFKSGFASVKRKLSSWLQRRRRGGDQRRRQDGDNDQRRRDDDDDQRRQDEQEAIEQQGADEANNVDLDNLPDHLTDDDVDDLAEQLRDGKIKEKELKKRGVCQEDIDDIKARAKDLRPRDHDIQKVIDDITKSRKGVEEALENVRRNPGDQDALDNLVEKQEQLRSIQQEFERLRRREHGN